jgi:hypothetical protein
MKASAAYAPKLVTRVLRNAEKRVPEGGRKTDYFFRTVTVELRNGGDGVIEEAELQVYFLDERGAPRLQEVQGTNPARPTFTWAHPVLRAGIHPAEAKALGPGESREFDIDVPETTDDPGVDPKAFGARITWVRLAK